MAAAPRSLFRTALVRTMAATWLASVVGAVLSFVYNVVLAPLPPGVGTRGDLLARNLPWFVACLNVCGLLLAYLIVTLVRRAATTTDAVERARRVVALPFAVAVPVGLCWVASAGAFVALNWNVGTRTGLKLVVSTCDDGTMKVYSPCMYDGLANRLRSRLSAKELSTSTP